jgi:hypothetical protein
MLFRGAIRFSYPAMFSFARVHVGFSASQLLRRLMKRGNVSLNAICGQALWPTNEHLTFQFLLQFTLRNFVLHIPPFSVYFFGREYT